MFTTIQTKNSNARLTLVSLLLSFILTPFTTVFAQNTDFFKEQRRITGSEFDIDNLENPQLNDIKALLQAEKNNRMLMTEGYVPSSTSSNLDYTNPHAPISINGVPLSYDKNGNLLFDGTTTYTYDYNNQLISTTKGGVTTTYLYDHMGQRIATISPTKTTYYPSKYYNVDSTGKVTKHIFAGDLMLATIQTGGTVSSETTSACTPPVSGDWIISTSCTFTGTAIAPASVIVNAGKVLTLSPNSKLLLDLKHNKLLVKHTGGVLIKKTATLRQVKPEDIGSGLGTTIAYHLTDHLGSTQVSTDATGAVTELSDYYPYGSPRLDQTTGSKEQRKFIGQEYDEDTGLNYLNARYYDSKRGQFISQDPMFWKLPQELLIDPQQMNSYSYARNNPLIYKDPTGNLTWDALFNDPVGSLQNAAGWGIASLGANAIDRPFTANLLRHSASLNPGDISINTKNQRQYGDVIDSIKGTSQYKDFLNKAVENAKNGKNITSGSVQFDKGDLYTSLHKANIQVSVEQGEGGWNANITITDKYDFNPTNPQTYKGTVTRIPATQAYKDQQKGVLSRYKVKIKFNDKIK